MTIDGLPSMFNDLVQKDVISFTLQSNGKPTFNFSGHVQIATEMSPIEQDTPLSTPASNTSSNNFNCYTFN